MTQTCGSRNSARAVLRAPAFPTTVHKELLEKFLRRTSAQEYEETALDAARIFRVSPSSVSRKLVALTAKKFEEFQERSLANLKSFAVLLDTIHRGGEAFLVALSLDLSEAKMAMGFW